MVEGQKLIGKVKGIYIKESTHMRSVEELYLQRNKYVNEDEYLMYILTVSVYGHLDLIQKKHQNIQVGLLWKFAEDKRIVNANSCSIKSER